MIKEREGIENTAIGILYNAIEMGEQKSQMNEKLEGTLRATNN